jgi:hypothetical protein
MKESYEESSEEFYPSSSNWISVCCGAAPLGEIDGDSDEPCGICSACRDHATFELEIPED